MSMNRVADPHVPGVRRSRGPIATLRTHLGRDPELEDTREDDRPDAAQGDPGQDERPRDGGYHVRIDAFEGPFDLLLQLISRRKLDVSEVDLSEITGDFLANLPDEAAIVALDLDTATHFLVVAATLIELKAARLLPTTDDGQLDELLAEVRDVLYARLLEYRAFRDVSELFAERLDDHADYVARDVPLEERFEDLVPDTQLSVDASGLAALAAAALAPKPEPKVSVAHIHHAYVTVREAASRVLERLRDPGERTTFSALSAGMSRPERVVHFLALLELYKLGHLELEQPERFGTLLVRRRRGNGDLSQIETDAGSAAPVTAG